MADILKQITYGFDPILEEGYLESKEFYLSRENVLGALAVMGEETEAPKWTPLHIQFTAIDHPARHLPSYSGSAELGAVPEHRRLVLPVVAQRFSFSSPVLMSRFSINWCLSHGLRHVADMGNEELEAEELQFAAAVSRQQEEIRAIENRSKPLNPLEVLYYAGQKRGAAYELTMRSPLERRAQRASRELLIGSFSHFVDIFDK